MRLFWTLVLTATVAACGKPPAPPGGDPAKQEYVQRMADQHAQDQPTPSPAAQAEPSGDVVGRMESYGKIGEQALNGYVAYPASAEGALPGVLMFHEWWGLNDNIRSMANQLAAQGYAVLAADMYGGKVAAKPDEAEKLMHAAIGNADAMRQNLAQAYDYLTNHMKATKVGTIGWCFGGTMSFEAGKLLGDRASAIVIYYGFVNGNAGELAQIKAPVLGLFGGKDQGIPPDMVKAFEDGLKKQGRAPEIQVYADAGHAFANPSGENYRKADAEDAWSKATSFLHAHLQQ